MYYINNYITVIGHIFCIIEKVICVLENRKRIFIYLNYFGGYYDFLFIIYIYIYIIFLRSSLIT